MSEATPATVWFEANGRYLDAAFARLQARVEALAHGGRPSASASLPAAPTMDEFGDGAPPALVSLASTFTLSPFEVDLLLLAAGPHLDADFGALCAAALGDPSLPFPTVGLALRVHPEPFWAALTPNAALRRWRLVEMPTVPSLLRGPLRLEERVLHFLRGVGAADERLAGMVSRLQPPAVLVPSHRDLAEHLAGVWAKGGADAPVALLAGSDAVGKRAVASAACGAVGLGVLLLPAALLPAVPSELAALGRLLARESALSSCAVLIDCDPSLEADGAAAAAKAPAFDPVACFADTFNGPLLVAASNRRRLGGRRLLPLDVARPTAAEQAILWRAAVGVEADDLDAPVARLTAQFDLDTETILAAGADALERAGAAGGEAALPAALWAAGRSHARPDIESLAQRLRPVAGWDDLVLPPAEKGVLAEIAVHVRHRITVHERWGFAARSSRGLGIAALFSGPSGTGKTMAAEVLARQMDLDLYRIDLASVVSKYIGETEKNLKRVFDAAETGGAILLFDEADALFGKRSEVRDSHDRYANIEIGYLLQRLEAYRGLAILTTNLKDSLDPAFLRRLRFVVRFPFPDRALRAEIWRRVFPPDTPTGELDVAALARLGLAGGNIKNIALAAAFRAAEEGVAVGMEHVIAAARGEFAKLDRPWTERDMGGAA